MQRLGGQAAVRARRGKKLATRVTVSVDERDYEQLSALAAAHRVSLAWLVRYAVSELLEPQRIRDAPRYFLVALRLLSDCPGNGSGVRVASDEGQIRLAGRSSPQE